jgi:hypothetical protein
MNGGGNAGPSHLDLIKGGAFSLKKFDPNEPERPKILPDEPKSHLDLIKKGEFSLKKVDRSEKTLASKTREKVDPSTLSLHEILERAAQIREAIAVSSSSEESGSKKSETSAW